jgi:hypothetical protein
MVLVRGLTCDCLREAPNTCGQSVSARQIAPDWAVLYVRPDGIFDQTAPRARLFETEGRSPRSMAWWLLSPENR